MLCLLLLLRTMHAYDFPSDPPSHHPTLSRDFYSYTYTRYNYDGTCIFLYHRRPCVFGGSCHRYFVFYCYYFLYPVTTVVPTNNR